MKNIAIVFIIMSLSVPAIADSTIPVVQFTIGFGEKIDIQRADVLGLHAGSDYAIYAVESEKKISDKKLLILS